MSGKGATVTVMYPRTENSTFNVDYYTSTHMALVWKAWSKFGLKSYIVTKCTEDAPYTYTVAMEWESLAAFGKAAAEPSSKEVMDDVPNFSSEKPVVVTGDVIDRS
ncbi:hypothetical protein K505DRAFT_248112 [Melanomma pulvis-pyrius CBS 109.77]|uniref:EthD domain-containing protein n=1 Tax=Melanomma pulvis-pyrius CBS 109.77 TaxID=1314802 RepID=A0A6A6X647_9PLEO|nr:hypothetical protein K505DRAFT_248112 [Melanomma pulvis-pyrius CBS 109.77]